MSDYLMVKRELLAMVMNALDRDAAEGKQARGEMADEIRDSLKAPAVAGDERETVSHDAELYGIGFMVDGVRVSPDRVTIQYGRPAQTEQQPICHVSEETFSSDGTSDIITCNLLIGIPLYAAPIAQTPADGLVEALRAALIELRDAMRHYFPYPDINPPAHEAIMARVDAALAAHRAGGAS